MKKLLTLDSKSFLCIESYFALNKEEKSLAVSLL